MKLNNLIFSLIVMVFMILLLAATGWMISFMMVMDINMTDGSLPSDFEVFGLRVYLGAILLGFVTGVSKLWDLFVFCMKYESTPEK